MIDIKQKGTAPIDSLISVRVQETDELDSSLNIMYRGNGDREALILAISSTYMDSVIEVRPHNQAFGRFELLEAPRKTAKLSPIADATVRSSEDYKTINYGELRTMGAGSNANEYFESFINFGDLSKAIPDLRIVKEAKLRLYYTGIYPKDQVIKLSQPDKLWREYGVNYVNRPLPVSLLKDKYTVNETEWYIEFDIMDVVAQWQNDTLPNYGFIITSDEPSLYYFYTRESSKPPTLQITYITNQIYSIGRSEIQSQMFIWGIGRSERSAVLEVHSDYGFSERSGMLYVHRPEVPLLSEQDGAIGVTRNWISGNLTSAYRDNKEIEAMIGYYYRKTDARDFLLSVSTPEKEAYITVDPRRSLPALIQAKAIKSSDRESNLTVSRPSQVGQITTSKYKRTQSEIDCTLTYAIQKSSEINASISISRPEITGKLAVRVTEASLREGIIEVPYSFNLESSLSVSRPSVPSMISVHYKSDMDGHIEVKERVELDCSLMVYSVSSIEATMLVMQHNEINTTLYVSKPELSAYVQARVPGSAELAGLADIRIKDARDLDCIFRARGQTRNTYYYIL